MKKFFKFFPLKKAKFILNKVINNKNFFEIFVLKTKDTYKIIRKYFKFKVYTGKQVHKSTIKIINNRNKSEMHKMKADAFITSEPQIAIAVRVADCVGSVIIDKKRKVIAVVHSGWRGVKNKIIYKTIKKMQKFFKCKPSDLIVSMSPAIGKCCYEIGEKVYNKLKKDKIFSNIFIVRNNKKYMDLYKGNYNLLLKAGVNKKNIYINNMCTFCNSDLFYSYRREGKKAGRMLYVAMIKK